MNAALVDQINRFGRPGKITDCPFCVVCYNNKLSVGQLFVSVKVLCGHLWVKFRLRNAVTWRPQSI